jgi:hypothetical protein
VLAAQAATARAVKEYTFFRDVSELYLVTGLE